jgi:hypothetical protein
MLPQYLNGPAPDISHNIVSLLYVLEMKVEGKKIVCCVADGL